MLLTASTGSERGNQRCWRLQLYGRGAQQLRQQQQHRRRAPLRPLARPNPSQNPRLLLLSHRVEGSRVCRQRHVRSVLELAVVKRGAGEGGFQQPREK